MGHVEAIHIAEASFPSPVISVEAVDVIAGEGVVGDRKFGSRRHVTVVSTDELDRASARLGNPIPPGSTRRQITITGVELPRTRGATLELGEVVIRVIGDCSPCNKMEESVGTGARAALVGLAGVTAEVVEGGRLKVGDEVKGPDSAGSAADVAMESG